MTKKMIFATGWLFFTCLLLNSIALAQQSQGPVSVDSATQDARIKKSALIARLNLKRFEKSEYSASCVPGKPCFKIERFECISTECSSASRNPTRCIRDEFVGDPVLGDRMLCEVIVNPSSENRKAFLNTFPMFVSEPELVSVVAFVNALKRSSIVCQDVIKDYVGTDAKSWTQDWLVAMSACRILGFERTREQEENDYFVWHNVSARTTTCNDIKSIEMKNACFAGVQAP